MTNLTHPPKYPSTPHWPDSLSVHRDDSYHQSPEGFVGHDVVITEKLDGGNTCLWNGEVYARSTTQPSNADWMGMVRKHHAWKTYGEAQLAFYGEDLFGIHSIEYDPMMENETYRVFAVRDATDHHFLDWDQTEALSVDKLQVATVPVLFRGTFSSVREITEWFQEHIQQPSQLGPVREGFVLRHTTKIDNTEFEYKVAKYVRANHVQTDQHWTKNWQPCKFKSENTV